MNDVSGAIEPDPVTTVEDLAAEIGVFRVSEVLLGPAPYLVEDRLSDHQSGAACHRDVMRPAVLLARASCEFIVPRTKQAPDFPTERRGPVERTGLHAAVGPFQPRANHSDLRVA